MSNSGRNGGDELPSVGGASLNRSLGDFERACLALLRDEQRKPVPERGALFGVLADAVRLAREYGGAIAEDAVARQQAALAAERHDDELREQLRVAEATNAAHRHVLDEIAETLAPFADSEAAGGETTGETKPSPAALAARAARQLRAAKRDVWLVAADILAGAVAWHVRAGMLDARSVAGDALLEYASIRYGDADPIGAVKRRYDALNRERHERQGARAKSE